MTMIWCNMAFQVKKKTLHTSFQAVLFICLMIISVYVGVLGCMSALSVNFDFVSMICLTMSAGFSVDFSVHITQHYILSQGREEATNKASNIIHLKSLFIARKNGETGYNERVFSLIPSGAIHK